MPLVGVATPVLARYYDPTVGQFLTVDPMVALSLSPYGYAADDPVNMSDPYGPLTAQTCVDDTSGSVLNLCMEVVSLDVERQVIAAEYAVVQRQMQELNAEGCQSSTAYSTLVNRATDLSDEYSQVATEENVLGNILNAFCSEGVCTHSPDLGVLGAALASFMGCLPFAPGPDDIGDIDAADWATVAVTPFICAAGGAIAYKAAGG